MANNEYHNKITSLSAYNKVIRHGFVSDNRSDAEMGKADIVKAIKEIL